MGVVPPPFRDHAHRIRTTVPCPPGHDIGQLADLMLGRESASWLMVAAAGAGTMGVWRSVSSWTGPSLQPAVFGSSALPGRIPGAARTGKSASPAGWACCGHCTR
jgi:hypothetical protein